MIGGVLCVRACMCAAACVWRSRTIQVDRRPAPGPDSEDPGRPPPPFALRMSRWQECAASDRTTFKLPQQIGASERRDAAPRSRHRDA